MDTTACTAARHGRREALDASLQPLAMVELGEGDRDRLAAHLLRLDADDRRMRFLRAMTDRDILAFVAGLDLRAATRLAFVDRAGELVAVCEGHAYRVGTRTDMELAFSTDVAWRRCGLATRLFRAMAAGARARGVDRLVLQCDRRNRGMRAALQRFGDAETREDADEVGAVWPCTEEHA